MVLDLSIYQSLEIYERNMYHLHNVVTLSSAGQGQLRILLLFIQKPGEPDLHYIYRVFLTISCVEITYDSMNYSSP